MRARVVKVRGLDKFLGSELEKKVKDRGVQTVIVTGTVANGTVIGTGEGAAMRGFKVIVPVDGMSGDDAFGELYVAWHFAHAPAVWRVSTLTRIDMIKF